MNAVFLLLGLLVVLVMAGAVEYLLHRRNLLSIPVRIHINGTRGKSSVTRLTAAALNHAGIRTFAKTTGTLPRMIFPDSQEYPVYRPGGHANVLEQLRIISVARAHKAQAVIVECMALQPLLQWISERKLVQATHGVITNAREDHLDVMGPTEKDVALALCGMVPRNQKMFTAETRNLGVFEMACKDRNSTLICATPEDVSSITPEDMAGFVYSEHEENVALVLKICESLGVDRSTAIQGMWKARPDAGALKTFEVDFFGRRLVFVNGFAANDPESTERIWSRVMREYQDVHRTIAVFNCRVDRQHRSMQLGQAYAAWPKADWVILMGSGTHIFSREASKLGVDPSRFVYCDGMSANEVFETIVAKAGRSALIVGMANIAGEGMQLIRFFENRSVLREDGKREAA